VADNLERELSSIEAKKKLVEKAQDEAISEENYIKADEMESQLKSLKQKVCCRFDLSTTV
jgi:hypothetical protein